MGDWSRKWGKESEVHVTALISGCTYKLVYNPWPVLFLIDVFRRDEHKGAIGFVRQNIALAGLKFFLNRVLELSYPTNDGLKKW